MEFDALHAHGLHRTIEELRTVKNDNRSLKTELAQQILINGDYKLPKINNESNSCTKLIIDSSIEFLSN